MGPPIGENKQNANFDSQPSEKMEGGAEALKSSNLEIDGQHPSEVINGPYKNAPQSSKLSNTSITSVQEGEAVFKSIAVGYINLFEELPQQKEGDASQDLIDQSFTFTMGYNTLDNLPVSYVKDNVTLAKEEFISIITQKYIMSLSLQGEKDYSSKVEHQFHQLDVQSGMDNLELIGEGRFKQVFKLALKTGDQIEKIVAASAIKPSSGLGHLTENSLKNELRMRILTTKKNVPGVLPNFGILLNPDTGNFILITKVCNKGSLKNFIELNPLHDYTTILMMIKNCWEIVTKLHEAGITHRDIKASNFLVHESKGQLKCYLGDFGLASNANEAVRGLLPSNETLVPPFSKENEGRDLANPKVDTWAFGLMMCQLLRSSNPKLVFDCDEPSLLNLYQVLPWLNPELPVEEKENEIKLFIEETFETPPFQMTEKTANSLKQLIFQMMEKDPASILEDKAVSHAIHHICTDLLIPPAT